MKIPEGMSETEVVNTIYKVCNALAKKFKFGCHPVEDMRQEGALIATKVLAEEKYDPARPLENFLYTHIRNRFINFKRNNYVRNEPPCNGCIFFDHKKKLCAEFADKEECEKFAKWQARNLAKKSLMKPADSGASQDTVSPNELRDTELHSYIDTSLPAELRSDYLRMIDGVNISSARKEKIREAITDILEEYNGH